MSRLFSAKALGLAAALLVVVAVAAATLPKLPPARALPQSADSPGVVTFSHRSHVDEAKPDCTVCHPKLFHILDKGAKARLPRLQHKQMDSGQQCGACHDGKAAHGFEDCATCHHEK